MQSMQTTEQAALTRDHPKDHPKDRPQHQPQDQPQDQPQGLPQDTLQVQQDTATENPQKIRVIQIGRKKISIVKSQHRGGWAHSEGNMVARIFFSWTSMYTENGKYSGQKIVIWRYAISITWSKATGTQP